MLSSWPLPAAIPSCPAVSRFQPIPSRDVQITAVVCARSPIGPFIPPARNPLPVLVRTSTRSFAAIGTIPRPDDSVHERPSLLVQIESAPTATHAPWPPATSRAACPGGGSPPPA